MRGMSFSTKLWCCAVIMGTIASWTWAEEPPLLRVLDPPAQVTTTTREAINVMGRTRPDAKVTVGGESARVFSTGVFVRDQVPLKLGTNTLEVVAEAQGKLAAHTLTVERVPLPVTTLSTAPQQLRLDEKSVRPAGEVILSGGEELVISVEGTPGQIAEFRVGQGKWLPMVEVADPASTVPTGRYRGVYVAPGVAEARRAEPLELRLRARPAKEAIVKVRGPEQVRLVTKTRITLWEETRLVLGRTTDDGTELVHGLHEVRLGGPYLAVLTSGTILRLTGKRDGYWHVALTPTLDAWVRENALELLPEGSPPPHHYFTLVSVGGDELSDIVTIPYPASARIPFAIIPVEGPSGRAQLWVDFYGAHNAATWISHRPSAKIVREVTVEQPAREHVRVKIDLKPRQLWGWLSEVTTNSLVVRLRRPPQLAKATSSPLEGLVIALEAGHGGPNTGARGVSGSLEKDINRLAVDELARQLRAKGARVVEARPGDENPTLGVRARRVTESSATLFISVHANSADQTRGYLRVSGTSTYYKYPFNRDLSEAIHARLLEMTKLADFGNVGNFNYLPIREVTWMPSMLVEQAFMSNPEDEAKMLDPEFRATMMKAVVQGIEDWLDAQRRMMQEENQAAPPGASQ